MTLCRSPISRFEKAPWSAVRCRLCSGMAGRQSQDGPCACCPLAGGQRRPAMILRIAFFLSLLFCCLGATEDSERWRHSTKDGYSGQGHPRSAKGILGGVLPFRGEGKGVEPGRAFTQDKVEVELTRSGGALEREPDRWRKADVKHLKPAAAGKGVQLPGGTAGEVGTSRWAVFCVCFCLCMST